MEMHHVRRGTGKPLVLIHGLGGSWQSWSTILDALAAKRDVIALDLPGHGNTPPLRGDISVPALADAVTSFLAAQKLTGADAVGSSMGARVVLELARRGQVGAVVSLDPGGFWRGWERHAFYASVAASIRLVRLLQPVMPAVTANPVGRSLLLAQFSAHPARLPQDVVLTEMRTFAASPVFDALLRSLAYGPEQQGIPAGTVHAPITIGWGRNDRVCLPVQAERALSLFPGAAVHWFGNCGHFPQWDQPTETVQLILSSTGA